MVLKLHARNQGANPTTIRPINEQLLLPYHLVTCMAYKEKSLIGIPFMYMVIGKYQVNCENVELSSSKRGFLVIKHCWSWSTSPRILKLLRFPNAQLTQLIAHLEIVTHYCGKSS